MRGTVLIAEDTKSLREALQLALTCRGVNVITASDGAELLGTLERVRPDLLLLDLLMPTIDGLTALRRIREKDLDLPVIVTTNLPISDDSWCKELSVSEVMIKSNTPLKTIAASVLKHLARVRRRNR